MSRVSTILHLAAVVVFLVALSMERTAGPSECLALPILVFGHAAFVAPIAHALLGRIVPQKQALFSVGMLFLLVPLLIAAVMGTLSSFAELLLRIFTLLAFPFGTVVYLALWGDFPRAAAGRALGGVLVLWLVAGGLLTASNLDFLRHKSVLGFLLGLLLIMAISLLHGWTPLVLVSILDALAAVVVGVVSIVWLLRTCISLLQSILAIRAALKASPSS